MWIRVILVGGGLAWLGFMLWHILEVRERDGVLAATGQAPLFVSQVRVSAALWSTLLLAYVTAISAALGLDLISRNFRGTLAPVVAFPVHVALGLGVFAALFFVLGIAAGGYSVWGLALVLLAGGVNVLRWHRWRPKEQGEIFENPPETFLWHFLVTALAVVAAAAALAPALSHDDLVYHLQSPRHMLDVGRIDAEDWNLYAHLPNLLHFLYVPMMAFDPLEAAPRLLTVFLGVMTAYCLYRVGGFWFSPRAGGVAGLLFLSTPVVLESWSTAGLDVAGAFFVTVAMLTMLIAPMNQGLSHMRLAGVFAGCALACRHSAIAADVGLVVFAASRWWRYRKDAEDTVGLYPPGLLRLLLAFAWPQALVILPFLLRDLVETGNPLFPFFFGGPGMTPEIASDATRWHHAMGMGGRTLHDFLMLPWRLVARAGMGSYERFGGALHPWMLLLAPLALGWPQHLRKVILLGLMLVAGGAVWFHLSQQSRFLMPMLPWVALIGGLGFDSLVRGFSKPARPWASAGLGLLMVGTGVFLQRPADLLRFSDNVQVTLTRGETRVEYLRRQLDIYPSIEWLNSHDSVTGVQMLWDNRGHYLEPRWVADPILEVPASLLRWRTIPVGGILEEFAHGHEFAVSHLLVREDSRDFVFEHAPHAITREEHDRIWQPLLRHLEEVHRDGPFVIYRVRESSRLISATGSD